MDVRERYEAKKDTDKRRTQESAPKPWWWLGQRDPIARFSIWLVIWTALLFLGTVGSAIILWKTDLTLNDTLIATQRPWVSVDVQPAGDVTISKDGMIIPVEYQLRNIGHSPASKIWISSRAYLAEFDYNVVKQQKTECSKSLRHSAAVGYLLFPNDIITPKTFLVIPRSALDKQRIKQAETADKMGFGPFPAQVSPIIVGCITYVLPFGSREYHQTGFAAQLRRIDKNSRIKIPRGISISGPVIPKDELTIDKSWMFSGGSAD